MKTSIQTGTQIQFTVIESQWGDSFSQYKKRCNTEHDLEIFKLENPNCRIVDIEEVPVYEFV